MPGPGIGSRVIHRAHMERRNKKWSKGEMSTASELKMLGFLPLEVVCIIKEYIPGPKRVRVRTIDDDGNNVFEWKDVKADDFVSENWTAAVFDMSTRR